MSAPASAETKSEGGCYGASCVGLDPTGRCDGDAKTVASIAISSWGAGYAGQLDLRYSPSCKANWGRFTASKKAFWGASIAYSGRVTAWNPGGESQHSVKISGSDIKRAFNGTNWTKMVDGTRVACVGVEVFSSKVNTETTASGTDWSESLGWFWGPCV